MLCAREVTVLRSLAPLLVVACVDPTAYTQPPALTTEVDDWRDEVVYQVLVDRFANGDRNNDFNENTSDQVLTSYMGGDWQGLIDQIPYLQELGVTAIWISPVVANVEVDAGISSYHGYWTQDFHEVNAHFGDIADLRRMVDEMHRADIKVIQDIVTNHVGQLFYYDINRNGLPDTTFYGSGDQDSLDGFGQDPIEIITEWDPAYDPGGIQGWTSLGVSGPAPLGWVYMPEINRVPPNPPEFRNDDWYNRRGRVTDWNQFDQVVKGDFPGGLKDLDTSRPDVRDALIRVFQRWIEQTNIDGFRIDTVKHVEHEFWQQFNPQIRQFAKERGKERFLQFGEVFDGNDQLLGSYTFDDELDSVFYFSHKFQVFNDVYQRGQATTKIQQLFQDRARNYSTAIPADGIGVAPRDALVNFMDNHDVPRFLFDKPEPAALKAALVHLITMDGIPCIYYGTEQGFAGGNDPANREPLWTTGYATDGDVFQHIAGLTRVRRAYAPLRRGDFQVRWVSDRIGTEEDAHLVAFERQFEGDSALVVINTAGAGTAHTSFQGNDMPVSFAPGTTLQVVFPPGDSRTFAVDGGGNVRVPVGPYEGLVLVPADAVVPLD